MCKRRGAQRGGAESDERACAHRHTVIRLGYVYGAERGAYTSWASYKSGNIMEKDLWGVDMFLPKTGATLHTH